MRRITTRMTSWIESYLEENSLGDDISWDVNCHLDETGFQAHLVFFMPSPIVGTLIMTPAVIIDAVGVGPEQVEMVVADAIETMRQARSAQAQIPSNGHG